MRTMRTSFEAGSGRVERARGLASAVRRAAAAMTIAGLASTATAWPFRATHEPHPPAAPAIAPPTPAPAQSGPLAIAGALKPGQWEVRFTDGGGEVVQRLCLGDPSALIQIRHPKTTCNRLVLANDPTAATVHYSCPGAGWGRTNLRANGPESVRIETQGIAANAPFSFSAVGKRTGECESGTQAH